MSAVTLASYSTNTRTSTEKVADTGTCSREIDMPDNLEWMIGAAVILLIAVVWIFLKMKRGPSVPAALRLGQSLPDFMATDEQGMLVG